MHQASGNDTALVTVFWIDTLAKSTPPPTLDDVAILFGRSKHEKWTFLEFFDIDLPHTPVPVPKLIHVFARILRVWV